VNPAIPTLITAALTLITPILTLADPAALAHEAHLLERVQLSLSHMEAQSESFSGV